MVGIIYAKDLLPITSEWDKLRAKDIMHKPIFIP